MATLIVNSSITLNLARPNSNVVVYAKQYDTATRQIDISLLSGTSVWDPQSNVEMVAMFAKPDGTMCIYDVVENYPVYSQDNTYSVGDRVIRQAAVYQCNTDIDTPESWNSSHWTYISSVTPAVVKTGTGTIRLILSDQALSAAGNVLAEISFFDLTKRITTLSFTIIVEKGVPNNDSMRSGNYFNVLSELIQGVLGASTRPPQIDPVTHNWLVWNTSTNQYVDSGFSSVGETGPRGYAVSSLTRVNETPAYPGEYNTYRMDLENGGSAGTFQVREGQDGTGAPGDATPLPASDTGSAGSQNAFSRQDHVHPKAAYNLSYDTLLNYVTVPGGSTNTVGTYASRSIENYNWFTAGLVLGSSVRATSIFRKEDFKNGEYISIHYVDSAGTQRYCELVYNSDTSVSIRGSSNIYTGTTVYLFGLVVA